MRRINWIPAEGKLAPWRNGNGWLRRVTQFRRSFDAGQMNVCDTFSAP